MLKPYVGTATRHGLQSFFPENDHTLRFLMRRAYCSHPNAVCFWAVVQDSIASIIEHLLNCGQHEEALLLLQSVAAELGTVCPDEPKELVVSAK